ncbi:MAG TPA: DUF2071 domain-containing protein [Thermoanaerobaculia bacterium]|nr:DUF2071 domain-containing protein [Thermoanaerobaculia bacterium]
MQSDAGVFADGPHRQYPAPHSPWVLRMVWEDLLFEHWRIGPDLLKPLIPRGLELETFDGSAWLAVVPFRMTGVRPRATPPLPWLSDFPELNVRTYVTAGGKPGVWFFSLDADQPVAVATARRLFHLNYRWAEMSCERSGNAVAYRSRRRRTGGKPAEYRANYWPLEAMVPTPRGSLADFLVNRFCLYAADKQGTVYRGEIDHPPWPLHEAAAEVTRDTMTAPLGFDLPAKEPLRWFAPRLEVVAWLPERVR